MTITREDVEKYRRVPGQPYTAPIGAPKPHVIYRCYEGDDLMYIGCTLNLPNRLQSQRSKMWWHLVTTITVEHFPDRESALAAEAEAIRTEKPRYNIEHNTGRLVLPGAHPQASIYWVEPGS